MWLMKEYRNKEVRDLMLLLLSLFWLWCTPVFHNICSVDDQNNFSTLLTILESTTISAVLSCASILCDCLISSALKDKLVGLFFMPRSGETIFSDIKNGQIKDSRFRTSDALSLYTGIMQKLPNEKAARREIENAEWYQIYQRYQEKGSVIQSQRDYLMCRDLFIETLAFLIVYILSVHIFPSVVCFSLKFLIVLFVLSIAFNICTHLKMSRFVTTVTQTAQEQQFHAALQTEDQQASHLAFQSEQGEFVGSVVQSDEFDASSEEARTEQSQVMQSALQQEQIGVTQREVQSEESRYAQRDTIAGFHAEQSGITQREQAQHIQQDTQTATFRQVESQSQQHTAQSNKQFFSVRNGLSKTTIAERTVQAQERPGRFLHSRTPSAAPASAPANEAPAGRSAPIPSTPTQFRSFGGTLFAKSLYQGGAFANDVIGTVAKGDYRTTGSITGETATRSLMSYMGFTALGEHATNIPRYQDVEIGGGRITGREFTPEHPGGIDFCMYHADQYAQPKGDYSKVYSADDAAWYKQYAADTVERKPYQTEDGKIAYHEKIVQKLPNPPQRKDRM